MFERTVLLSPMLGIRAPTVKPEGQAWAKPFIPRILALALLNGIGIHVFDHLPVLAFAIAPRQANILTSHYSFLLMGAFATTDYAADLRNAASPMSRFGPGTAPMWSALDSGVGLSSVPHAAPALPLGFASLKGRGSEVSILRLRKIWSAEEHVVVFAVDAGGGGATRARGR
jgi:hypothetical protein